MNLSFSNTNPSKYIILSITVNAASISATSLALLTNYNLNILAQLQKRI